MSPSLPIALTPAVQTCSGEQSRFEDSFLRIDAQLYQPHDWRRRCKVTAVRERKCDGGGVCEQGSHACMVACKAARGSLGNDNATFGAPPARRTKLLGLKGRLFALARMRAHVRCWILRLVPPLGCPVVAWASCSSNTPLDTALASRSAFVVTIHVSRQVTRAFPTELFDG